jgi:hypothetical protein
MREAQDMARKGQDQSSSLVNPQLLPLRGPGPAGPTREILARLEKAKQYREMADKRFSGSASQTPAPAQSCSEQTRSAAEPSGELQASSSLVTQWAEQSPASTAPASEQNEVEENSTTMAVNAAPADSGRTELESPIKLRDSGRGSAVKAANFLSNVCHYCYGFFLFKCWSEFLVQ